MFLLSKPVQRRRKKHPNPAQPVAVVSPVFSGLKAASPGLKQGYFYLGLILLILFILQKAGSYQWPRLTRLQTDDIYKQLTGFMLVAYLAIQWRCSWQRTRGLMYKAAQQLYQHKWLGALAPLLLYLHAQQLGHGYIFALSLAFLGIFVTGICNMEIVGIRKPWFRKIWLTVHVGLATALLFLLSYHIYISYAYE